MTFPPIMLLALLVIPIAIEGFFFFFLNGDSRYNFNLAEFGAGLLAALMVGIGVYVLFVGSKGVDTKVLSGLAYDKYKEVNERTVCDEYKTIVTETNSQGTPTATETKCIKEHKEYDHTWSVKMDDGAYITLKSQTTLDDSWIGLSDPAHWDELRLIARGDSAPTPLATTAIYYNVLRAMDGKSLYSVHTGITSPIVPDRPVTHRNIYNWPRFIVYRGLGFDRTDAYDRNFDNWVPGSQELQKLNANLGDHQNIQVIVIPPFSARNYAMQLSEAWNFGAENDVTIILWATSTRTEWADVLFGLPGEGATSTPAKSNTRFRSVLQEELPSPSQIVPWVGAHLIYNLRDLGEFDNLKGQVSLEIWQIITIFIIVGVMSIFIALVGLTTDVFKLEGRG